MILFSVSERKEQMLQERMERLGVKETDICETFVRASGPGGQKVNKTSTCVVLVHQPTGLSVKCQQERTQSMNRFLARRMLLDKIEFLQKGIMSEKQQKIEKIKRQKRKRSKRAQEKTLRLKHQQSEKKALRAKQPIPDNE